MQLARTSLRPVAETDGQDAFTESNYRLFFGLALDVLVRPWEKFVVSLKYSEVRACHSPVEVFSNLTSIPQLGAIRFDHDLRAVVAYLSSQTVFGDVREKFVRLQQIGTLLNLDSVRESMSQTLTSTDMGHRRKTWTSSTTDRASHGS